MSAAHKKGMKMSQDNGPRQASACTRETLRVNAPAGQAQVGRGLPSRTRPMGVTIGQASFISLDRVPPELMRG
jgi:hypothetical protein